MPLEPNRWNRVVPPADILIDTATLGAATTRLRTSLLYRPPGEVIAPMDTCIASLVKNFVSRVRVYFRDLIGPSLQCEHVSVGMLLDAGEESAFLFVGEG